MKLFLFSSLFFVFLACRNFSNKTATKEFGKHISEYLPLGVFSVDVYDSLRRTNMQKKVLAKFEKSIATKADQLSDYVETLNKTGKLVYNPILGLSRNEFDTLLTLQDSFELIQTTKSRLEITESFNKINFHQNGSGKLDPLSIDLKDSTTRFKDFILKYSDTLTLNQNETGLAEKVTGCLFSYKGPRGLLDLYDLGEEERYNLILGKMTSGTSVIILTGKEIHGGKTTLDFRSAYVLREMVMN